LARLILLYANAKQGMELTHMDGSRS